MIGSSLLCYVLPLVFIYSSKKTLCVEILEGSSKNANDSQSNILFSFKSKSKENNSSEIIESLWQVQIDRETDLPIIDKSYLKTQKLDLELSNNTQKSWRPFLGNSKLQTMLHSKPRLPKPTNYYETFFRDNFLGVESFENHACRRNCQPGRSLSCYYQLIVHNYQRLGPECQRCQSDVNACEQEHCIFGDGVPTPVMAVNRRIPGPSIEICENDTVTIDVINYLLEPMTMHWHGMPMMQTPDMDGTPFITQYPIQPGELYRYKFIADRSGTLWYHSHVGRQRGLGICGSFIIRQTRQKNSHAKLYDYDLIEHTLMIQDIFYNFDFDRIRNILINGKGRNHFASWPDTDQRNRYERVRVTPGYRYRMRVINNGINYCPIEFSIENHKMLIIATDGNDIAPVLADSFFMSSGERFDFVLEANQYASNYWIRVRGYGNCSKENIYQGAVLHYSGAARNAKPLQNLFDNESEERNLEKTEFVVVNRAPIIAKTAKDNVNNKATDIATASLRALNPLTWSPYTEFLTYYSSFGGAVLVNGDKVFQIDDITFDLPNFSMLQARNLYNENAYYCNRTSLLDAGNNCIRENCVCTNVIRMPAYRPIELVMVNYMESTHPVHIHGYTFRVVGQGVIPNAADLRRIEELDRRGVLQRSPPDFSAVEKDTAQIPGNGYLIIRFLSTNPGYWLYHCHIESHALKGMLAVLKIGEQFQMKSTPPRIRC